MTAWSSRTLAGQSCRMSAWASDREISRETPARLNKPWLVTREVRRGALLNAQVDDVVHFFQRFVFHSGPFHGHKLIHFAME